MELVENDYNIVKCKSIITVTDVNEDIYDSSLKLIAEEFNFLEIFEDDKA